MVTGNLSEAGITRMLIFSCFCFLSTSFAALAEDGQACSELLDVEDATQEGLEMLQAKAGKLTSSKELAKTSTVQVAKRYSSSERDPEFERLATQMFKGNRVSEEPTTEKIRFRARHKGWIDILDLYKDGFLQRYHTHDAGVWQVNAKNQLVLKWLHWNETALQSADGGKSFEANGQDKMTIKSFAQPAWWLARFKDNDKTHSQDLALVNTKAIIRAHMGGSKADLDEKGYRTVVSLKDNSEMEKYIRRVVDSLKMTVLNAGKLAGMTSYYSGVKTSQSLHKMKTELMGIAWGPHEGRWVMDRVDGSDATLDEEGYRAVALLKNNAEMEKYIRRVAEESLHATIVNVDGLKALVPYYSGIWSRQSFASMTEDLKEAAQESGDARWLLQRTDGTKANLDEVGYAAVAKLKNNAEMEKYMRRVVESLDLRVINEGGLKGILPYYSGVKTWQSLQKLRQELKETSVKSKELRWVMDKKWSMEQSRLAPGMSLLQEQTNESDAEVSGEEEQEDAEGQEEEAEGEEEEDNVEEQGELQGDSEEHEAEGEEEEDNVEEQGELQGDSEEHEEKDVNQNVSLAQAEQTVEFAGEVQADEEEDVQEEEDAEDDEEEVEEEQMEETTIQEHEANATENGNETQHEGEGNVEDYEEEEVEEEEEQEGEYEEEQEEEEDMGEHEANATENVNATEHDEEAYVEDHEGQAEDEEEEEDNGEHEANASQSVVETQHDEEEYAEEDEEEAEDAEEEAGETEEQDEEEEDAGDHEEVRTEQRKGGSREEAIMEIEEEIKKAEEAVKKHEEKVNEVQEESQEADLDKERLEKELLEEERTLLQESDVEKIRFRARHKDWIDIIDLYKDGFFARYHDHDAGIWHVNKDKNIVLKWLRWGEEELQSTDGGRSFNASGTGKFTLKSFVQPDWWRKHFQRSDGALLQELAQQTRKSKTDQHTDMEDRKEIIRAHMNGGVAPLDDSGYVAVAMLKDDSEMKTYIQRVVESMNLEVASEGGLNGMVPYYSGMKTWQTLGKMKTEIRDAAKRSGWVIDRTGQDPNLALLQRDATRTSPPGQEEHTEKDIRDHYQSKVSDASSKDSSKDAQLHRKQQEIDFERQLLEESDIEKIRFRARHDDWIDILDLYKDGFFKRYHDRDVGVWQRNGKDQLVLKWLQWGEEDLQSVDGGRSFSKAGKGNFSLKSYVQPVWWRKTFDGSDEARLQEQSKSSAKSKIGKSHTLDMKAIITAHVNGGNADLDEVGYKFVAMLKSNDEMKTFIRRLAKSMHMVVNDEGGLNGIVPYYSGEITYQTLVKLREELTQTARKPIEGVRWVMDQGGEDPTHAF